MDNVETWRDRVEREQLPAESARSMDKNTVNGEDTETESIFSNKINEYVETLIRKVEEKDLKIQRLQQDSVKTKRDNRAYEAAFKTMKERLELRNTQLAHLRAQHEFHCHQIDYTIQQTTATREIELRSLNSMASHYETRIQSLESESNIQKRQIKCFESINNINDRKLWDFDVRTEYQQQEIIRLNRENEWMRSVGSINEERLASIGVRNQNQELEIIRLEREIAELQDWTGIRSLTREKVQDMEYEIRCHQENVGRLCKELEEKECRIHHLETQVMGQPSGSDLTRDRFANADYKVANLNTKAAQTDELIKYEL